MNLIHFFLNFINTEIRTDNFEKELDVAIFSAINQVFLPAGCVIKQMTSLFFFRYQGWTDGLGPCTFRNRKVPVQVQDPFRKNCLFCVYLDSLVSFLQSVLEQSEV